MGGKQEILEFVGQVLDSNRSRWSIGERKFVSCKEFFGSFSGGNDDAGFGAEEKVDDGAIAKGKIVKISVRKRGNKVKVSDDRESSRAGRTTSLPRFCLEYYSNYDGGD